jgi:hypothetical protein
MTNATATSVPSRVLSAIRRLPRCAKVTFGIVLALSALIFGPHIYYAIRIHQELIAIRKTGNPTTVAEMGMWTPLLRARSAARTYSLATGKMKWIQSAPSDQLLREGMASRQQGGRVSHEMEAYALECLRANAEALALLHQAGSDAELRRAEPTPADMTYTVSLSWAYQAACLPGLEAVECAGRSDAEGAANAMVSSFRAAYWLHAWPSEITRKAQAESTERCLSDLEGVLNRVALAEPGLTELDKLLLRAEDQDGLTTALVGGRCVYDNLASSSLASIAGARSICPPLVARAVYKLTPLRAADRLAILLERTALVKVSRTPFPARLAAYKAWSDSHKKCWSESFLGLSLGTSGDVIILDATTVALLRAARAALAVERFRSAKGSLPESLDALVPEFIAAIPLDPFDGNPVSYRRTDKGYVTYSIGEDRRDDGGRMRMEESPDAPYDEVFTVAR